MRPGCCQVFSHASDDLSRWDYAATVVLTDLKNFRAGKPLGKSINVYRAAAEFIGLALGAAQLLSGGDIPNAKLDHRDDQPKLFNAVRPLLGFSENASNDAAVACLQRIHGVVAAIERGEEAMGRLPAEDLRIAQIFFDRLKARASSDATDAALTWGASFSDFADRLR